MNKKYQDAAVSDDAEEAVRIAILNALGTSFATKRKDAVGFRSVSGIETEWEGDEAFYQGYDDANRSEFARTVSKPTAAGGSSEIPKTAGSTVFPNITQPYVDAVSARVGDIMLPSGRKNFAMHETPAPDFMGDLPEEPAPVPQQVQPGQPAPQQEAPLSDVERARIDFARMKAEASRKAKKAETRIDDWLLECQYHAEARKVIDDASKLGSGVLKGPVPVMRNTGKPARDETGAIVLLLVEEMKPASFRIDPWNLFPDPACGESIHNGAYIFERDYLTEKRLEDLRGLPGYIDSQIDLCIEEGPGKSRDGTTHNVNDAMIKKDQYEIWYCHAEVKADELTAAGCDCDGEKTSYPAILTMVNDRVIRAALNPLDNGEFPYDVIPWKRRPGMPWGTGIARQLRTPQRIVVGATRRLMDNLGLAGGPQFVVRRGVRPEDGIWEIVPLKMWVEEDDAAGNATSPVSAVVIPTMQQELAATIQLAMKMAEDVTGMPALMQGQQGAAPDTVGGMQILNNNANAVLRRIARLFDSCITEPHIRRYYNWLMQYGEDEDEKGDYRIVALGSTSLVEMDIQNSEMVNVLQLTLNPAYGKNPKLAMDEYLKSRRFDPKTFDYTEAERKKMEAQPAPPPPQVQAAQIRAEADAAKTDKVLSQKAQSDDKRAQVDMALDKSDTDRDMIYSQAEMARTQSEHDARMQELQLKLELARLDYANRMQISLDELKTKLAIKTMDLNTTRELAQGGAPASQLPKPPVEPAGTAENGKSFSQ